MLQNSDHGVRIRFCTGEDELLQVHRTRNHENEQRDPYDVGDSLQLFGNLAAMFHKLDNFRKAYALHQVDPTDFCRR